jgi:hypothetical protein
MRWFIILCIALVLSAFAIYRNQERPTSREVTGTTTPESLVLYQDDLLGFGITYQNQHKVKTDGFEGFLPMTNTPIFAIELPSSLFIGTNLSEAGVYIGASSSNAIFNTCSKPSKDAGEIYIGKTTINGGIWHVFTSTGVGAGNIYEQETYRTTYEYTCYEMTVLLHSGNIHNYPEGAVVEFDKPKFQNLLNSIARTFTFAQ